MFGLTPTQYQQIRSILFSIPEVKEAWIFGSRARGDYKPYSDIDISLDGDLHTTQLAILEQRLDDLYLPYRIDLLNMRTIHNPALIENIHRDGVKL